MIFIFICILLFLLFKFPLKYNKTSFKLCRFWRTNFFFLPAPQIMSLSFSKSVEERYNTLRSVGEECIQENELRSLIEKKKDRIRCYDGFEPSGRMHIAQGLFKAINVNKCTSSGCTFFFWVADWFALMNDKVGGSLENIKIVGKYLVEVWKAAGMDMENVEFLWTSEEISANAKEYWRRVLDIGRQNSIARIKKCCTIMGKQEGTLTGAQILYPLMQCGDIFFLKADICQLGLDQRKVNMLAREYCDLTHQKLKPIILSHHMLSGLKENQAKMSKSDPDSAIFMEDSAEDVTRKICQAYCPRVSQKKSEISDDGTPESSIEKNPILDYYECIVFSRPNEKVCINNKEFNNYDSLETAFLEGELSETEIKAALAEIINKYLDPVRKHFSSDVEGKKILDQVKSFYKSSSSISSSQYEPSSSAVACVWVPCVLKLPFDTCLSIVEEVNSFLEIHCEGVVNVILPDWSSFVADQLTGNETYISSALQFNANLLQVMGLSSKAKIMKESSFIFSDTSFWEATINAGRHYTLNKIELTLGNLRNAGEVIGTLMKIASATHLKATHIISLKYDEKVHKLTEEYTQMKIQVISACEGQIPLLHKPDATISGNDDVLFACDTEMDVRRKIKKAYCAPNEASNPIIDLALYFLKKDDTISIERDEKNGGTAFYSNKTQLIGDCISGSLHPADLKGFVGKRFVEKTTAVQFFLKNGDSKKLLQTLHAAEKKMTKK